MVIVWMKVTDDAYELPEVVALSSQELADKCGVTRNAIESEVSRFRKGILKSCKYRRVEIDD